MLTSILVARPAHAEPSPRVVTIDAGRELEHAISVALASWHADVVSSDTPAPGHDLDDAVRTGHRVARRSHARIVVWVSGGSIWIYDDGTRGVVVRRLPSSPPFDEETAAAIALTLKSVMHEALERPTQPLDLADETAPPETHPRKPDTHTVRIDTFGGMRVPTNASDVIAARFGAELTYFPAWLHALGIAVSGEAGPSVLVEHPPYFLGTATDTIAALSLRLRLPLRPWFSVELGVGPGIHFTALEGSSETLGLSGRVTRTDPSIETMLAIELAWKVLRVSPMLGTSFRAHYEHYSVLGVHVFDIPPGQMLYALRIGVELP